MTYTSYAQLAAEHVLGVDYRIVMSYRGTPEAVVAPHGWSMETGTHELAEAIAGAEMDGPAWSVYEFRATMPANNTDLHITSTLFDEPTCEWLLKQSMRVITVHGKSGSTPMAYVGGLDTLARDRVAAELTAAGFTVATPTESYDGDDPANLCNRGLSGMGVQLELTTALRASMFGTNTAAGRWDSRTDVFYDFVRAVRRGFAMDEYTLG